jgi:hypothetical protein
MAKTPRAGLTVVRTPTTCREFYPPGIGMA